MPEEHRVGSLIGTHLVGLVRHKADDPRGHVGQGDLRAPGLVVVADGPERVPVRFREAGEKASVLLQDAFNRPPAVQELQRVFGAKDIHEFLLRRGVLREQIEVLEDGSLADRVCAAPADELELRWNTVLSWPPGMVRSTAVGLSSADPNDGGMMDVVGFDTTAPTVMADFAR